MQTWDIPVMLTNARYTRAPNTHKATIPRVLGGRTHVVVTSLVKAQTTASDTAACTSVRRNIACFRAVKWQIHFDTLRHGAIVCDTRSMALHFWSEDEATQLIYPCSVQMSRRGRTEITLKRRNPTWIPTPNMRERNPDLPERVGLGPENPMGTRAMDLTWHYYRIHGIDDPAKVGRRRLWPPTSEHRDARTDFGRDTTGPMVRTMKTEMNDMPHDYQAPGGTGARRPIRHRAERRGMTAGMMLVALIIAVTVAPVAAHHPGEQMDEATAELEPAFEATDIRRAPSLRLTGVDGGDFALSDLRGRIVVLSFVPEEGSVSYQDQQAKLLRVQEAVNITPMRDRVMFLTVAAPDTMGEIATNWDTENWQQASPAEDGVAAAEETFRAVISGQTKAPLIHVIDRSGRHAGVFEGADFDHVNLVFYVSELSNAPTPEPGLLERVRDRVLDIFE